MRICPPERQSARPRSAWRTSANSRTSTALRTGNTSAPIRRRGHEATKRSFACCSISTPICVVHKDPNTNGKARNWLSCKTPAASPHSEVIHEDEERRARHTPRFGFRPDSRPVGERVRPHLTHNAQCFLWRGPKSLFLPFREMAPTRQLALIPVSETPVRT